MNRKTLAGTALALFLLAFQAGAQYGAPPPAPNGMMLAPQQLDQLTGPIALYPDPLIAQILPAAAQPSQIAVAYSYVSYVGSGSDQNAIDQQPWDDSVKALAHYPDVLKTMNDNLPWTTELGQAFLNQPSDVMASIQRLRAQAQQLGNLQTTPQATVDEDDGTIDIVPTDPDMLYVPAYDPGLIFYMPGYGRPFLTWGVGFRIGFWLNHDFDWHDHRVVVWGRDHPRPANWWHERPAVRREAFSHATAWHPPTREPGRTVFNRPAARGDRGFVDRDIKVAQPRVETPKRPEPPRQPAAPVHVEPPRTSTPVRPTETHPMQTPRPVAMPAPRPVETRVAPAAPSRPSVSAFIGSQSAPQTRAASTRGSSSQQAAGGGGGGRHR